MMSFVLHNADTGTLDRIFPTGNGQPALSMPLPSGLFWAGVRTPATGCALHLGQSLMEDSDAGYVFRTDTFGDRLSMSCEPTRSSIASHIFLASLPDAIGTRIVDDPGAIERLGKILKGCVDGNPDGEAFASAIPGSDPLTSLRAIISVLRGWRLHGAEATALRVALALKPSAGLHRQLSMAALRSLDAGTAHRSARKAHAAEPEYESSAYAAHLSELRAHRALMTEVERHADHPPAAVKGNPQRHVAYCLQNALPYNQGGYAQRSHALAQAIGNDGEAITAFVRPGFPKDTGISAEAASETYRLGSIDYHFHNAFGISGRCYGYLLEAADYFEAEFRSCGITLVHGATSFWTALPAALAAKRLCLPFLYEVRSFWTLTREAAEPGYRDTPIARRNDALEDICHGLADHIVTLNQHMRDYLRNCGVAGDGISLAPNCVDTERFAPGSKDPDLAARYGIEEDDTVVGYIGAMLDYEGLDLLVEAAAELIARELPIKLLLFGADIRRCDQAGSVENRLLRQIERHDIQARVQLHGRIASNAAPNHYRLFDICAYPRRDEEVCQLVSPLKPLEAMAAGRAVLVSDVGGMAAMIDDGETGLTHRAEDIGDLAKQLAGLAADSKLRTRLGSAARALVLDRRNWRQSASACIQLYDHLDVFDQESGCKSRQRTLWDAITVLQTGSRPR